MSRRRDRHIRRLNMAVKNLTPISLIHLAARLHGQRFCFTQRIRHTRIMSSIAAPMSVTTQSVCPDITAHVSKASKSEAISSEERDHGRRMVKINASFMRSLIGEPILSCSFRRGSKKGDNIAGNLKAVTIRTLSGKQESIIIKFLPTDNRDMLSYLILARIMEIENEFYGSILPEMEQMLKESKIQENLPFPKHYGGTDLFLALEDLRPKGYRMAKNKFKGLKNDEVSAVMSALGRFHAASYAYIRHNGDGIFRSNKIRSKLLHFTWKPEGMEPEYFQETINMFTPAVQILKNQDKDLSLKLEKLTTQFYDLLPGIYNRTDTEYFPVLCHGDLWVNNVLFNYENGTTVNAKFVDLQQLHRGNIFEDLLHFLITSTTPESRTVHLSKWLEQYHSAFVILLQKISCPLPKEFSSEWLIQQYYRNLKPFSVFVGATIAFHFGGSGGIEDCVEEEEAKTEFTENSDVQSDDDVGCVCIRRYDADELTPLGAHYKALEGYVRSSILGEPRALQMFVETMREFDKLGVFDDCP